MTIDGTTRSVTVSGGNAVRVFSVNYGVNFILQNLTVANGVSLFGGGIVNYGALTLMNSTFLNNQAPHIFSFGGYGGGIYNAGTLTVTNSIFLGNVSHLSDGGGISNSGTLTVTNSTFSNNGAYGGSGTGSGISNDGTATIRNSIIANSISGHNCRGTFGGANNLANDTSCRSSFTNSSSILLGTLGNYGGSTQTIPLLPGSSAIKATNTNCPQTDQRGITRGTTCDIGAYESQGFTLTKTNGDNQSTLVNMAFTNLLALSVTSAYSEPVNGGQVILTAPTSGASITATTPLTLTIASGAISQTVRANSTLGAYNITASATGATSVTFALTNTVPPIVYAKPSGLTSGLCKSWANACELRYAITSTVSGQEIWVAAGKYTPTASATDRNATFQLKSGVAVYGGFAGIEITPPNGLQEPTSPFSRRLLGNDNSNVAYDEPTRAENSYHVVTGATGAILDNVTIAAGNANKGAIQTIAAEGCSTTPAVRR